MKKNKIDEVNFYNNSYNVNEIIHNNVEIHKNYIYKPKQEITGFIKINSKEYAKKNIFLPRPQRIEPNGNIVYSGKFAYDKVKLLNKVLAYSQQIYSAVSIDYLSSYISKLEKKIPLMDNQFEDFKNPKIKEVFIKFFKEFGISNNYKDKRRLHFSL